MIKEMEQKFTVLENQTAAHLGSGTLKVLATPALVAMVENTAMKLAEHYLAAGEATVGSYLDIKHLRPSALGAEIRVHCEVVQQQKNLFEFTFEAFDGAKKIASGNHTRASVVTQDFLNKLAQSSSSEK